jgi:glutathione S-transferase
MQDTELDPVLSETLQKAGRHMPTLVIGNKNYSSWSMRPWVTMVAFDIPFKEVRVLLDQPETANEIARYTGSGRVPVLLDGDMAIWDSLSICEYLAEQFPDRGLWPARTDARAIARSITAEMHSGFAGLRSAMSMDIRARYPGQGRGHHEFLFGDFSIADAFYAPVVMRFVSYQVPLAPALQAYADRVCAHPAVARWIAEALAEKEVLPDHK